MTSSPGGLACAGEAASGIIIVPWSVTDDDRRRQTPESKTILAPQHYV